MGTKFCLSFLICCVLSNQGNLILAQQDFDYINDFADDIEADTDLDYCRPNSTGDGYLIPGRSYVYKVREDEEEKCIPKKAPEDLRGEQPINWFCTLEACRQSLNSSSCLQNSICEGLVNFGQQVIEFDENDDKCTLTHATEEMNSTISGRIFNSPENCTRHLKSSCMSGSICEGTLPVGKEIYFFDSSEECTRKRVTERMRFSKQVNSFRTPEECKIHIESPCKQKSICNGALPIGKKIYYLDNESRTCKDVIATERMRLKKQGNSFYSFKDCELYL